MELNLRDFFAYQNSFKYNKTYLLRWDIKAIVTALDYLEDNYKLTLGQKELIDGVTALDERYVKAILYGAMFSAGSIDAESFEKLNIPYEKCIFKIFQGLSSYLPPPQITDTGEDLDESYPDTQSKVTAANRDEVGGWIWLALTKLKIPSKDVERLSLKNIVLRYKKQLEDEGFVQYEEGDE